MMKPSKRKLVIENRSGAFNLDHIYETDLRLLNVNEQTEMNEWRR